MAWREHETGLFETDTSGATEPATKGRTVSTATTTLPETLNLRFESADLGCECNGVPNLRQQFQGMKLTANIEPGAEEWAIDDDTGRVNQYLQVDGLWRLTAHVLVDLHPPYKPAQKCRIFPVYSLASPDSFSGAGPWRLQLHPETERVNDFETLTLGI
jgi:hypothetical protein